VNQFGSEIGEREYSVIDELIAIGKSHDANAAAIALAWVRSRPGVAAPVIGIRTLAQLDANLAALDVVLSVDEIAKLDALSSPPATFLACANGQQLKCLTVIDEFTRECLAIDVAGAFVPTASSRSSAN
jgi:diketogulonate reductase-like aldo/keto reductase